MRIMAGNKTFVGRILTTFFILTSLSDFCAGKVLRSAEDSSIEGMVIANDPSPGEYNFNAGDLDGEPEGAELEQDDTKALPDQNIQVLDLPTWSRFTSHKLSENKRANGFPLSSLYTNYLSLPHLAPFDSAIPGTQKRYMMEQQQQQSAMPSNIHQDPNTKFLVQPEALRGVGGSLSNYVSDFDTAGLRLRPMNSNYHRRSFAGSFGGVGGGRGRHSSPFMPPIAPRKRQILFRQCFFNPISCF